MKKLLALALLLSSGLFAASPVKTSLVQLRRDLTAWRASFVLKQDQARADGRNAWYTMPMSDERKAIDKEYADKFDARLDAAAKALKDMGLTDEAEVVLWFRNESVSPAFKTYLDKFQNFLGELD